MNLRMMEDNKPYPIRITWSQLSKMVGWVPPLNPIGKVTVERVTAIERLVDQGSLHGKVEALKIHRFAKSEDFDSTAGVILNDIILELMRTKK